MGCVFGRFAGGLCVLRTSLGAAKGNITVARPSLGRFAHSGWGVVFFCCTLVVGACGFIGGACTRANLGRSFAGAQGWGYYGRQELAFQKEPGFCVP